MNLSPSCAFLSADATLMASRPMLEARKRILVCKQQTWRGEQLTKHYTISGEFRHSKLIFHAVTSMEPCSCAYTTDLPVHPYAHSLFQLCLVKKRRFELGAPYRL